MQKHITVVGALHIGYGAWGLLWALLIFMFFLGIGVISGDRTALAVLTGIGCLGPLALLAVSVPGIVGGIGVLMLKPWARYLALVVSVVDLLSIPIGTAVGVYSIWALVQDETAELFAQGSGQ
jgi:hypothetical protein